MRGLFVALAIFAAACGTTTQTTGGLATGKAVTPASKVLIVTLSDAIDKGGQTIGGSGGAATGSIRDSLLKRGFSPIVGDSHSLADAFTEAQKLGCAYVLKGSLVGWEDNATEWSGRPDTAGLSIEVYEVVSRDLVGSASNTVSASNISFTAGAPDRFLPDLTTATLNKVFGFHV